METSQTLPANAVQIGPCLLFCGDCAEVLATLEAVDVIIGDPPYSAHTHKKQWIGAALTDGGAKRVKTAHKELGFAPLTPELRAFVSFQAARLCKRWSLFFTDIEGVDGWINSIVQADLEYVRTCIWDKVDSAPQFTGDRPAASAEAIVCAHPEGKKRWNGGGSRSVFRYEANAEKGAKPHPSTKPVRLMQRLVDLFSDEGETVLDPFMGSGTTGIACIRTGRRFIGIEKDPKHFQTAKERIERELQQLTFL